MKLRIDQLGAQLKRQLAPVYIVSGDEPLQVAQCCDQIRQYARDSGFSERHVYHVENGFDWGDFLSTANSLSLFAQKQILELRIPNGKPGDSGSKALLEYISHPSPDNLLLMVTERLDNTLQKSKWFKALEHAGVFITIWPIESGQLPNWLNQQLKMAGYQATPDALSLIAERVEGNLLAASQELEKLKLLAKDKTIDEATVREAVSDNARYDVFQLLDTALEGNIKQCVRILGILKGEGIEPPIILWALAREIRLLSHLSRQLSRGLASDLAIEQSAKALGFAPFMLKRRKSLLEKAIRRSSERNLRQMLLYTGKIDRCIKGLDKGNAWDGLLTLTLNLAGLSPINAIT
ncbi:DNA polymerase III subunit delta [Endozoicomonas sp. SCSIO W0465]|uniref:DNA polymerase III subunit delta n=1 Tax=Endozoicomonas sp. SCSIO W0465 TaxID=2918516 RepID=UPI002075B26E|nr:DNA polymerase III subunit delta [Endozoicomonas sp. SCSIO W0465]USE37882.1 DNA polymerase III subunit delta [Endozoicomonas sp. SCSIO W0465]